MSMNSNLCKLALAKAEVALRECLNMAHKLDDYVLQVRAEAALEALGTNHEESFGLEQ